MDSLIQRAWDLYQHTAGWPRETILTAAVWLEEKYRKTPRQRIALAIAIHYLILALRDDTSLDSRPCAGILRPCGALANPGVRRERRFLIRQDHGRSFVSVALVMALANAG
jgi:hypothetical protein